MHRSPTLKDIHRRFPQFKRSPQLLISTEPIIPFLGEHSPVLQQQNRIGHIRTCYVTKRLMLLTVR